MKYFLLRLLFLVFFLYGSFFASNRIHAENTQGGLTVSPAFQDIVLDQSDLKKDFFVSLTNATSVPITLHLVAYDFGSLDDSGGVAFLGASSDLTKQYALASWLHTEKDVITIESGETTKILATIENNEALSPGGHYGGLMFRSEDNPVDATGALSNDISVKQMFSTLVFVKKIGGEIYSLKFDGQDHEQLHFLFQDRINLRFQNSGNVHVVPRGIITIKDLLRRVIAKGIINQESSIILPETVRNYPTQLITEAWSFIPGRYILEIAYRYDGKDDFSVITSEYFFIPPLFTGSVLLLFVGLGGIYFLRKKLK